ncbi:hypothetical protein HZC08_02290 [Candidatus Micrarchaeota archaeon]|nr:hypothetical protein [Candidatus Micrarchaeota archaeon]
MKNLHFRGIRSLVVPLVAVALAFSCAKKLPPDCIDPKGQQVVCPDSIALVKSELQCVNSIGAIKLGDGKLVLPTSWIAGVKVEVEPGANVKNKLVIQISEGTQAVVQLPFCHDSTLPR